MRPFLLRLESLVWVLVSVTPAENSLLLELLKAMVSSHQLKQKLQAFLQLLFGFHKWVSCMLFLNWIVSSCLIAPIRTTMRILSMGVLSSIVNSDSSLSLICRQANQVTHHLSKRLDGMLVPIFSCQSLFYQFFLLLMKWYKTSPLRKKFILFIKYMLIIVMTNISFIFISKKRLFYFN